MIIYVYYIALIVIVAFVVLNVMYYFPKKTKKVAKFVAGPSKAVINWLYP